MTKRGFLYMKIAQCTDTFLPITDGVGRVVHAYATGLSSLGHEVTVISPLYDTGHRANYPFELVDYLSYAVPTAPQYKMGTAAADAHYRKRISMVKLDILHAHGPFGAGREALRLARLRDIPLVVSFHSKYYDDFYKVTKSSSISKIAVSNIVHFYERCDDVWAVSAPTADVLREYGFKGPIRVMPNGVTPRTADPSAAERVKRLLGLRDEPMLLFVGQINWKKNILRVLEASALLRREGRSFRLVLAGKGPDEEAVMSKIKELGLEDVCALPGHITDAADLDALYSCSSLLVFPSLYDNAPMVVREAAVMGLPSVMVRGSDAAVVVHEGENGFLCDDSAEDLARVIGGALDAPEETSMIGERARRDIPVFWESLMPQVIKAYEEIIENFQGRTRRKPSRPANAYSIWDSEDE